jgi:hypothetical protein
MNDIHDNVMGLHVVSGDYNKFGFNLIYNNKPHAASEGIATDAITIDDSANEDLVPLEAILYEEDGKEYAVKCERDGAGNVTKRLLFFGAPQHSGIVSIFHVQDFNQPDKFIISCQFEEGKGCDITDLPQNILTLIPQGECGLDDYRINAIFTGSGSTELMTKYQILDGVVAFVSNPYDIPTTGGASDVDIASGVDNEISEETASENSAGGAGGFIEGNVSSPSGCGGQASLADDSFRSVIFTFNAWWTIFFLAIVLACRLSVAKCCTRWRNRK